MAKGPDMWEVITRAIRDRLGPAFDIDDRMVREVLTRIENKDRLEVVQSGLVRVSDLKSDPAMPWVNVPVSKSFAAMLADLKLFEGLDPKPEAPVRPAISSEGW